MNPNVFASFSLAQKTNQIPAHVCFKIPRDSEVVPRNTYPYLLDIAYHKQYTSGHDQWGQNPGFIKHLTSSIFL